jgi:hypothetical protein
MIDFKEVVDTVAKATKMPLTYVDNKDIRDNLETLIDTCADFNKTMYTTSLELSKQTVEAAKKVDYAKLFATAK